MKRTIVVFAAAILLTCGTAARGQWAGYDPAVKKLMPKDQLEILEKFEALAEQHRTLLFRIKDEKKRGEENLRLGAEVRKLQEVLTTKLQTEGLKGWVGVCNTIMPDNAVLLDTWQPLITNMKLSDKRKPIGAAEAALREIKINDIVRFSTTADPTYVTPPPLGNTFGAAYLTIKISSLASAEKAGTWQRPVPPAKAPPARRNKR
jgi:hypothetical protein